MRETNGRFLQKAKSVKIDLSEAGLFIGDEAVILKTSDRFHPRTAEDMEKAFNIQTHQDKDNFMKRLHKLGQLLNQGRLAEAVLYATMANWYLRSNQARLGLTIGKANFNPAEPRDDRGRWSEDTDPAESPPLTQDIQYRGYFHDIVVDRFIQDIIDGGGKAIKNINVFGINGVLAIPDGGSIVTGKNEPFFIEVKTGFDPKFTENQREVYPLICLGGHAVSVDPRIRSLGLIPGAPLPPMDIMIVHTYGPGLPFRLESYCETHNYWRQPDVH